MKKNQNTDWIQQMNSIVKTGGVNDCFFKAQIRKDSAKNYILKVFAANSDSVVIFDLKTKSEKKALELADNYLDSINMINYGMNDEFDLH